MLEPEKAQTARLALGPTKNGAVKLSADDEVSTGLHIGEGVETVLAGMMPLRWYRLPLTANSSWALWPLTVVVVPAAVLTTPSMLYGPLEPSSVRLASPS